MVDPSVRGVAEVELAILSAMMAGAVTGAVTSWIARRNFLLSIGGFIIGLMGGMVIGTGMAHLCYSHADGVDLPPIRSGLGSLFACGLAGLAGAVPTALVVTTLIAFLTLRHYHPRPPRIKTALTGFALGSIMGLLTALMMAVV